MTMKNHLMSALIVTLFLSVPPAVGQNSLITYVADDGDAAINCGARSAPCVSFQVGVARTVAGGRVEALKLTSGGSLKITQAITIDGHALAVIGYENVSCGSLR